MAPQVESDLLLGEVEHLALLRESLGAGGGAHLRPAQTASEVLEGGG